MSEEMYRQGDLLFIKTDSIGDDCIKTESLDILGSSVTGHTHRLTSGVVFTHEPTRVDRANFYIAVPTGTEIVHEEHASIPIPEGYYKVIRQREVNGYVRD